MEVLEVSGYTEEDKLQHRGEISGAEAGQGKRSLRGATSRSQRQGLRTTDQLLYKRIRRAEPGDVRSATSAEKSLRAVVCGDTKKVSMHRQEGAGAAGQEESSDFDIIKGRNGGRRDDRSGLDGGRRRHAVHRDGSGAGAPASWC